MEKINDKLFEEEKKIKEQADKEFIEKADVSKTIGLFILDRWEELMGDVYHRMYTEFPEQMSIEIINLLLEREREIPE